MLRLGFSLSLILLAGCTSDPKRESESLPLVQLDFTTRLVAKGRIQVILSGKCPFPDDTIVTVRTSKFEEVDRRGKLESGAVGGGSGLTTVEGGRFTHDQLVEPGPLRVTILLQDDFQERSIAAAIRNQFAPRVWEFEFFVWDEKLLPALHLGFSEVESLAGEVWTLVREAEAACITKESWAAKEQALATRIEAALASWNAFKHRSLYPAATANLRKVLNHLVADPRNFVWNADGTFRGVFLAPARKWVLGPDGGFFSFPRLAEGVDQTRDIARREFALWIVKAMRKVGRRQALLVAARNGPVESKSLEKEDLEQAELRLRGKSRPPEVAVVLQPNGLAEPVRKDLEDARTLLNEADRLWEQVDDHESPAIYRRLLKEYPQAVDDLKVRVRVTHRARDAD